MKVIIIWNLIWHQTVGIASRLNLLSKLIFRETHNTVNCDYPRFDGIQNIYSQIILRNPQTHNPPPLHHTTATTTPTGWCDVYNNARPGLRPERAFEWRWRLWANFERHRGGSYDMVYLGVPNYPNKGRPDGTMPAINTVGTTRADRWGMIPPPPFVVL